MHFYRAIWAIFGYIVIGILLLNTVSAMFIGNAGRREMFLKKVIAKGFFYLLYFFANFLILKSFSESWGMKR